jgi:O-antigen ligase
VGIVIGVALSILSGSRSGWIAVPIVAAVWLHLNVPAIERRGRAVLPLTVLLAAFVIGAGAYFALPKVHQRVHEAIDDVTTYSLSGKAPESPVGLRLTFMRIAGDLIAQHPLAGVGDTSRTPPAPASQFPYATLSAVHTAFSSAFHNQTITDTVRHGFAGGIAAILMLLVPLWIYAHRLPRAAVGIAYGTCILVASMTTEVVDLKYTASLYALMTAVLCARALADEQD